MDGDPQFSNESKSQYDPIEKSYGVTPAEKYLGQLCERTFLSLWSFQCVYRDEGKPHGKGHGKEICDLLVVFDDHIIIFSDKYCHLQNSGDVVRDWRRWFKKTIQKSAEQAWGAERWIRQNPSRIFLDRECTKQLPIELPKIENAKFHLVVVAHGVSSRIKEIFKGGSGSLLIDTHIRGFNSHAETFHVGDLAPERTFVHVFDDDSLHTLMTNRDTISDFVAYLSKREKLLRGKCKILVTGEEQLLAIYLINLNSDEEHDFVFPLIPSGEAPNYICLPEGHWEDFQKKPQRIAQLNEDKISYAWDELIEKFNYYAMRGKQHFVTDGGIKDTEKILRFMARTSRWQRRYLAKHILKMVYTTPATDRRVNVLLPGWPGDPYYVFLFLPTIHAKTNEEYRTVRRQHLEDCCMVAKLMNPDAKDILGIATESGADYAGRSEDAIYLDTREWNIEMEENAKMLQGKLGILTKAKRYEEHATEYPEAPTASAKIKNPRNKPCPCGSGKKYKHCCLNKQR